jgi:hypothetical protein
LSHSSCPYFALVILEMGVSQTMSHWHLPGSDFDF